MQHRYSLLDNLVRVILYLLRCDLTDIYIYMQRIIISVTYVVNM